MSTEQDPDAEEAPKTAVPEAAPPDEEAQKTAPPEVAVLLLLTHPMVLAG